MTMNDHAKSLRELADWLESTSLPEGVTVTTEYPDGGKSEVSFHTNNRMEEVMAIIGGEFDTSDKGLPKRWFSNEEGFLGFSEAVVFA